MTTSTAVILAAGLGSRLGEYTEHQPKGFLQIFQDEVSLIERSIQTLKKQGIKNIFIGTGYLKEFYESLEERYSNVVCIENKHYKTTGSLYTLQQVIPSLPHEESILLLESDLLYEESGIRELINHYQSNVILASDPTNSKDEVYIEADSNKQLLALSKHSSQLHSIYGELVGITKMSYEVLQEMRKIEASQWDYEDALVQLSQTFNIHVEKIPNYVWCEIDTPEHWKFAREEIWPRIQLIEQKIKRNILLNPGPATTTTAVKLAQVQPDICPREIEFGNLMQDVSIKLTQIVANPKHYTTVLFSGSGTAAVESVLTSTIQPNDQVLIINNGSYGSRMVDICKAFHVPFVEYKQDVTKPLNLNKIEKLLNTTKVTHLAVVHNETTTGILNNLDDLSKLCQTYHLIFIVDAMSSFAAIPIDMERQKIDFLMASSNKNIQGMAGISFVICNEKQMLKLKNHHSNNFYLNLYDQYEYFKKTGQSRFTPPVQTLYALQAAIEEARFETIEARYKRYSQTWDVLISGLRDLHLEPVIPLEHHSKIITAIYEPNNSNYSFEELHDKMFEQGFTIYPGKIGNLNTFRIANIGAINSEDMEHFIHLLKEYFKKIER